MHRILSHELSDRQHAHTIWIKDFSEVELSGGTPFSDVEYGQIYQIPHNAYLNLLQKKGGALL